MKVYYEQDADFNLIKDKKIVAEIKPISKKKTEES